MGVGPFGSWGPLGRRRVGLVKLVVFVFVEEFIEEMHGGGYPGVSKRSMGSQGDLIWIGRPTVTLALIFFILLEPGWQLCSAPCSNLLVISAETGFNKWACNTCPYEFPITKQMTSHTRLERKQVDDVLHHENPESASTHLEALGQRRIAQNPTVPLEATRSASIVDSPCEVPGVMSCQP